MYTFLQYKRLRWRSSRSYRRSHHRRKCCCHNLECSLLHTHLLDRTESLGRYNCHSFRHSRRRRTRLCHIQKHRRCTNRRCRMYLGRHTSRKYHRNRQSRSLCHRSLEHIHKCHQSCTLRHSSSRRSCHRSHRHRNRAHCNLARIRTSVHCRTCQRHPNKRRNCHRIRHFRIVCLSNQNCCKSLALAIALATCLASW